MTEENESPRHKKMKIPTKIFNSAFMDSVLKSRKKQYDKMNLEGIVESFVRNSLSHNEVSSFLNDSNYSIFSKTAHKNITPQKSAIDLIAQEHRNLQAKNRLRTKKKEAKIEEKDSKQKGTNGKNSRTSGKAK